MNKQIVPTQPRPTELTSLKGRMVPKFLVEKYAGMERDIVEFLQAYFYHAQNPDPSKLKTQKDLARADANARMAALSQTSVLEQSFEEAKVIQLHEANKTGWYANTDNIHSLSEMIEVTLAKQIEKDPSGGTRYELEHLLRVLQRIETMALNEAAQHGDTSDETSEQISQAVIGMIANPKARRKMRESAKVVDKILQSDATEKDKWDKVADVFKDVASPDVTYLSFLDRNKERMSGLGAEIIEPAEANIFLFMGKEMIIIESRTQDMTRAIESACHGLTTDFGVSDPARLLNALNDALYSAGKFHQYQLEGDTLAERSVGVNLPDPEHFQTMVIREAATSARIVKELACYQNVFLNVFTIVKKPLLNDIEGELCKVFNLDTSDQLQQLVRAIDQLYTIPDDINMIFPGFTCEIGIGYLANEANLGLYIYQQEVNNG